MWGAFRSDCVLYGDLHAMGDGGDNRDGSLGSGYRQISRKTNSVLGTNAWIDRRRENEIIIHGILIFFGSENVKIPYPSVKEEF